MLKSRTLKALLLASTVIFAATAQAQDAKGDPFPADEPTAATTDDRAQDTGQPDDEIPLIQTPQSASVILVDRFDEMGALNLHDSLRYATGVRTDAYGLDARGDYGFIRGIEAPIYQDGLRRTFGYREGPRPELFTLSRIEILRGASAMLHGQGSVGGLLNIVTKRPEFETQGTLFASYGSFDRKELGFDLTGPLVTDQLAGRVIGVWRDSESQTDFATDRRWLLNASLTWQIGEDTSLTLLGQAQNDESGWVGQILPLAGTLRDAPNGRLSWSTQLGEPSTDRVDLDSQWIAANFSHQFSHVVEFRQNLRQEWFRSNQYLHYADVYTNPDDPFLDPADAYLNVWFPDYAARGQDRILNRFAFGELFRSSVFTSDSQLQFDFSTGALTHELLAGIDYVHHSSTMRSTGGYSGAAALDTNGLPVLSLAPSATPIDAYAPEFGNIIANPLIDDGRQVQTQLGAYLQSQTRAFDKVLLVLGIRRDRFEDNVASLGEIVHKATTGRAGLMVDLGGGVLPYVNYSESFLPINGRDASGNRYLPQHGRQYELGLKWRPDSSAMLTVAAFDLDDENRLLADPGNPLNAVQAGKISTQGIELEASKSLPGNFDIVATYSYTRAKDRARGNLQVESVPRHLASLWGTKYLSLNEEVGLQLGAGVRYVDESVSETLSGSGKVISPDYVLADALIAIDRGPWSLTVSATNLFDKKYYSTCLGRGDCFVGIRRTVNATLGFSF